MKKVSTILFDSVGKRKQNFDCLAEVEMNNDGKYYIDTYCALGAVGCENKTIKLNPDAGDKWGALNGDDEELILKKAGIPIKDIHKDYRPLMSYEALVAISKTDLYILRNKIPLDELITTLNDQCEWTFKQIGQEIEKLERFEISYNWEKKK